MTTVTFNIGSSSGALPAAPTAKKARGFWRRAYDAMVQARLRQAELELARYREVLPAEPVKDAGHRPAGIRRMGALPFVR